MQVRITPTFIFSGSLNASFLPLCPKDLYKTNTKTLRLNSQRNIFFLIIDNFSKQILFQRAASGLL